MPVFGGYETVAEHRQGGLGAVYAAREVGGKGRARFAVKTFDPSAQIASYGNEERQLRQFVTQAGRQQSLVEAGAIHWSPVYEAGVADDVAYYVTDLYERSAESLAKGFVKLDNPSLFNIVDGILKGLSELKGRQGRPHGRLKSSNVLISDGDDLARVNVFLTDALEPERLNAEEAAIADLRGVGEVIHYLVTHQQVRTVGGASIGDSPDWRLLGKHADRWRALCEGLLDPGAATAITSLEQAMASIEPMREGASRGLPWWVKVACLLIVAGLAVGGTLYMKRTPALNGSEGLAQLAIQSEEDLSKFLDEYDAGWYQYIINNTTRFKTDWASIDELRPVLEKLSKHDAKSVLLGTALGKTVNLISSPQERQEAWLRYSDPNFAKSEEVNTVYGTYDELRNAIRKCLIDADALITSLRDHGLGNVVEALPAEFLEGICTATHLDATEADASQCPSPVFTIPHINTIETASLLARYEEQHDVLVAKANAITEQEAVVDRADRFFGRVSQALENSLRNFDGADLESLLAAMQRHEATLDAIGQATGALSSVHKDVYDSSEAKRLDGIDLLLLSHLDQWRAEITKKDWQPLDPDTDPRKGLEQLLADTTGKRSTYVDRIRIECEQDDPVPDWENTTRTRLRAIMVPGWFEGTKQRVETESASFREDLQKAVDLVTAELNRCGEGCRIARQEWRDRSGRFDGFAYATLNAEFVKAIDAIDQAAEDRAYEFCAGYEEVEAQYRDFEKQLNQVTLEDPGDPRSLDPIVVTAFEAERDEAIRTFASAMTPDPAIESLNIWIQSARVLDDDYEELKRLLDDAYGLTDDTGGRTVDDIHSRCVTNLTHPDVERAYTGLDDRVQALRELPGKQSIAELLNAAQTGDAELKWAAWRAVESLNAQTTAGDLDRIRELGDLVRSYAGDLSNARRDVLITGVNDGLQARWQQVARGLTNTSDIPEVLRRAPDFGVDDDVLKSWGWRTMRYNLALSDMNKIRDDAQNAGGQALDLTDRWRDLEIRLNEIGLAEATRLLGEIDDLRNRRNISFQDVGPGKAGLQPNVAADKTSWVEYTLGGERMKFWLVAMPVGPPVYICEEEVSVAVGQGILDLDGGLSTELRPLWSRGDEPRFGPRTWARSRFRLPDPPKWIRQTPPLETLDDRGISRYPVGLATAPTERHPLQQVTGAAALRLAGAIHCRVPTESEWRQAASYAGQNDVGNANLRDDAWARQHAHVDQLNSQGLDVGVLYPADGGFAQYDPDDPGARSTNDGVVWFREVNVDPSNAMLKNLIGNVAEFVMPDGSVSGLDPLAGQSLAQLGDLGSRCAVAGGSAQTHPNVGLDPRPQEYDSQAQGGLDRWSDVGFRLAFTGEEGLASRMNTVLGQYSYLLGQ